MIKNTSIDINIYDKQLKFYIKKNEIYSYKIFKNNFLIK